MPRARWLLKPLYHTIPSPVWWLEILKIGNTKRYLFYWKTMTKGHTNCLQKEETIQFWNELHAATAGKDEQSPANHHSNKKEWIVHPNEALLDILWRQIRMNHLLRHKNSKHRHLRILEIGCGTSTLSADLFHYNYDDNRHAKHGNGNRASAAVHNDSQDSGNVSGLEIVATDVSEVCIQQQQQKRQHERLQQNDTLHSHSTDECGTLEYRVWNVTEPPPPDFIGSFDVVLDKGCLDTFLYRSRQRGPGVNVLVQRVLAHVHACLSSSSSSSSFSSSSSHNCTEEASCSRYFVISPRRKHKSLRDYPGFTKLERHDLDSNRSTHSNTSTSMTIQPGDLDGHQQNKKNPCRGEQPNMFLHVCTKNSKFDPNNNDDDGHNDTDSRTIPTDNSKCLHCQMTFYQYRQGENLDGRGCSFWYRRWKGHTTHCRGGTQCPGVWSFKRLYTTWEEEYLLSVNLSFFLLREVADKL